MKKEKNLMICSIFIGLAILITGIAYQNSQKGVMVEDISAKEEIVIAEDTFLPEQQEKQAEEKEQDSRNCCYVCGAVKNPGVYDFSEGARLEEVIALAGGFTKEAAVNYLNLAETVSDSQKIYVPTEKEAETQEYADIKGMESVKENPEEKVNLNTADREKLITLPGIGESKADRILSYRKEHGKFQSIEELKDIDGIKDGVFNKVKDLIVVQ